MLYQENVSHILSVHFRDPARCRQSFVTSECELPGRLIPDMSYNRKPTLHQANRTVPIRRAVF